MVRATRHGAFNQLVVMDTDYAGTADLVFWVAGGETLPALTSSLSALTGPMVGRWSVACAVS